MDVDARIEALEAECERLRARIEQLEVAMGLDLLTPLEWGLTGSEMRVFGVLLTREIATKDACMAALYRDVCRDEPELKIIDVFICKIRKKLTAFDVPIETIWGQGYRLSAETKARVRERLSRGVAG